MGDRSAVSERVRQAWNDAEERTRDNQGLTLTVAFNYGGRWDILQAIEKLVRLYPEQKENFSEEQLAPLMAMNYAPEPDLFIRTGGEQRISNYLLWHLAYTELYFTSKLWPDFDKAALEEAIDWYASRERRFGRTSEQLKSD